MTSLGLFTDKPGRTSCDGLRKVRHCLAFLSLKDVLAQHYWASTLKIPVKCRVYADTNAVCHVSMGLVGPKGRFTCTFPHM
jgi:hypothetical protein